MRLRLTRGYTDLGVVGHLAIIGTDDSQKWSCATIERPWQENAVGKSCIPEGAYTLRLRGSGIVARTTKSEFTNGWEVTGVPGRSLVMIHVANFASELEGCIGVGRVQVVMDGKVAVNDSLHTFRDMMKQLAVRMTWQLEIRGASARL